MIAEAVRWWVLAAALATWVAIPAFERRDPVAVERYRGRCAAAPAWAVLAMQVAIVVACLVAMPPAIAVGLVRKIGGRRG